MLLKSHNSNYWLIINVDQYSWNQSTSNDTQSDQQNRDIWLISCPILVPLKNTLSIATIYSLNAAKETSQFMILFLPIKKRSCSFGHGCLPEDSYEDETSHTKASANCSTAVRLKPAASSMAGNVQSEIPAEKINKDHWANTTKQHLGYTC